MNTQVGAFKKAGTLDKFAQHPADYYNGTVNLNGWEHFAKNHIAFDLGFDNKLEDSKEIERLVQQMDKEYELVLIRLIYIRLI